MVGDAADLESYLVAQRGGSEAAAEFRQILDHRGVVANEPIDALAHLQIGRAYAMQADTAKAKAAHQDFLTLWKDADLDVPILIAAKTEYAKLMERTGSSWPGASGFQTPVQQKYQAAIQNVELALMEVA